MTNYANSNHCPPSATVLVKVEGNETLAEPYHFYNQNCNQGTKSMYERNSASFLGSRLTTSLQMTIDGVSDPCRVSVWPPDSNSHSLSAAVTRRYTVSQVIQQQHGKSITEWIQLHEPVKEEINNNLDNDLDNDLDDKKSKQNDAYPGVVFFNPFTCEYRFEIPSQRGRNHVPISTWHGTCRARVSITSGQQPVPTIQTFTAASEQEQCGHVSNVVQGLFSKCAACGSATKVRCVFQKHKEHGSGQSSGGTDDAWDDDALTANKDGHWQRKHVDEADEGGGDTSKNANTTELQDWKPTSSLDHVRIMKLALAVDLPKN